MSSPLDSNVSGETWMLCMGILFFGPLLVVVVGGFLRPGRKGWMRTHRSAFWENAPLADSRSRVLHALKQQGFEVRAGQDQNQIDAKRDARTASTLGLQHYGVHTHAEKVVNARCKFETVLSGTRVRLELWLSDFIIADTGEGAYVDGIMDALLADPEAKAGPVKAPPNHLLLFRWALMLGVMIAACPIALLVLRHDFSRSVGVTLAMLVFVPAGLVLPIVGFVGTHLRPGQVTGQRQGVHAMVLTMAGTIVALATFYVLHSADFHKVLEQGRQAKAAAKSADSRK